MKVLAAAAGLSCATALLLVSLWAGPSSRSTAAVAGCNCVAFRFDDIQDYFLSDAQVEVMSVFERRNASLTIGIIGNYFGSDPRMVNFVQEKVSNSDLFEVANHGWDHEAFPLFTKEEQSALIAKTNAKISELLGVTPQVFITPYNVINKDTFAAARENGMRYVSANVTRDPPPYDIYGEQGLYRLPETSLMGDLNHDDTEWLSFSHEEVFADVKHSMGEYGFAVVTMHPQEFSARVGLDFQNKVDSSQIKELETLLDMIGQEKIRVVKISEIVSAANVPQDAGATRREELVNS